MEHNKFKRSNTEKGSTSNNIERASKNETNWETFQNVRRYKNAYHVCDLAKFGPQLKKQNDVKIM